MPKSWVQKRAELFVAVVNDLGMTLPLEVAIVALSERVEAVAAALHISEESARRYFTEDDVRDLAASSVETFADEAPGADVLALTRDAAVTFETFGRTIAGLAEASQLAPSDTAENHVDAASIASAISAFGQILADTHPVNLLNGRVPLPSPALHRAARYLDDAANIVEERGHPKVATEQRHPICDAFRRDAAALRRAAQR